MTSLPAIGAEMIVSPATALLWCEGTPNTPGTVNLHGNGARRGGKDRSTGKRTLLLLLLLVLLLLLLLLVVLGRTTLYRSRQIVLNGDGVSNVVLEKVRDISPSRQLKTHRLFKFSGKNVNACRIIPTRVVSVDDVLESNGQI